MTPRKSLSEDWEDVADDNLSVISLPSSEESESITLPDAKHMTMPTTSTWSQPTLSAPIDIPQPAMLTLAGGFSVRPGNDVRALRHQLYYLKDEIIRAIENLSEHSRHLTPSVEMWAVHILQQYYQVSDSIAAILWVTPREWKEQGVSGGVTYEEFVRFDTGRIHQYALRLYQVLDSLEAAYLCSRQRLLSDPRASDEAVREVEIKLTESILEDEGRLHNLERLVLDLGVMLEKWKVLGRDSDLARLV